MSNPSSSSHRPSIQIPAAVKIAGIYLLVGALWIFYSDQLLNLLLYGSSSNVAHTITQFQTLKGWFYVGITAAMLYGLIHREVMANHRATTKLKRAIAELQVTQLALQANQQQFAAFMDHSPAAFWITSVEGRLDYVSPAYTEMFQVSSNPVGRNVFDLYPPDIAQAYLDNIHTVVNTGQMLETIEPGICKDGHRGQFLVYKFLLPQPDGSNHVGGVALDITDLKRSEAALQASEEQLRLALDFTQIGSWDWDLQTNHIFWNTNHFGLLGLDPDTVEASYDNWRDRVHPDDLARIEAAINIALETHTSFAEEYRVIYPDGSLHWLIGKGRAMYDAAETPIRMLGVLLDITDRRQVENALRRSESQFRQALLNAPLPTLLHTEAGRVLQVSHAWTKITGYSIAEIPTVADWLERAYGDRKDAVRADITKVYPLKRPTSMGEYSITTQTGDTRIWDIYASPLGQVLGSERLVIAMALDVTERKQAEIALHQREQEFRALVENAPDIIVRFDSALRHLYVNPAVTVATGLLPQTFIGKTNQDLGMPAVHVAQWNSAFGRVFTTGQQQYLEFQFPTPEGIRDYQARCVPEFAADGSVASALVVARDITGQKQLERILRQQAERLELTSAIAQRIRQSLNLNEILNTTVVEVKRWLQADRVIVYRFAPDKSGTIVAESVAAGWQITLGQQITDTCFQTGSGTDYYCQGKKRAIANVYEAGLTDCHLQLLEQLNVKAMIVVPILLMDSRAETPVYLWGLLIAHQCGAPREWHSDQLELLDQIALQLAIAIQQAQIFERSQTELAERQQAERHLRAALSEKEVLLKEIHHRVKNNLQIVSGLLQLQAQGLNDSQIVNALRESQNRVESMSLIHKKLYTSSDLGQIDVADYIQSLALSLLTTYQISPGTIALQVEVEPVVLSLDQAIPCGLIINELVSNALKYAFPDNYRSSEITVGLHQVDGELELTIQDNGIGLPQNLNWQNAQSLGLSLVSALATEQLDGTLVVDHSSGTKFTIKFPQSLPKQ